jgi:hypothetical protein
MIYVVIKNISRMDRGARVEKSVDKVSVCCVVSMASIPLVMTLGNSMLIPVLPLFYSFSPFSPFLFLA